MSQTVGRFGSFYGKEKRKSEDAEKERLLLPQKKEKHRTSGRVTAMFVVRFLHTFFAFLSFGGKGYLLIYDKKH